MDQTTVDQRIAAISVDFAKQRAERQLRRELDRADFDLLRDAGFPWVSVPVERGGLWQSAPQSARPICELLRVLARGDSSVALVCAMHPAVLSYWLTAPHELEDEPGWQSQFRDVIQSAADGAWWGTITSEPGSGGDITCSRAVAVRREEDLSYAISGRKHFGSGLGVMSFMVTTAVPEGESQADWYFVDVRNVPWDGSRGLSLIAEWDGHGMAATQSHAMSFERFPATRMAWTGNLLNVAARAGGLIGCLFTSVVVGIVDAAMSTAAGQMAPPQLPAFEKVEWTRAQIDHWLVLQAYDGMLRAVETQADPRRDVLLGKTAVAELAETLLARLCRIIGGSTFSRRSPFGFWFEDVRALGFLRPPWGLAFKTLMDSLPPATR